ncbi:PAS domain-containing protein [Actinoplanes sp. NBRC 103695]|uniref:PAS domain-containing protein n=1 Tax=Actinoplanes sp. NBRC 103695 TaxID=3032202 RepID=UPI002552D0A8|nr:PAS domain-containing protein [Actinoplanes sp. NBRC 103695]
MARDRYVSPPTLSAAHGGRTFPTWHATCAYLLGCGVPEADIAGWLSRWCQVADVIGYRGARPPRSDPGTRGPAPECRSVATVADFRSALRQIFRWTEAGSQAAFIREAGCRGISLAKATLSDMLTSGRSDNLPSAASTRTFLIASALPPDHVEQWMAIHDSLVRSGRGGQEKPPVQAQPDSAASPGRLPDDHYEDAPCGLLTTLPDGTIEHVNRTFLELTGHSRDALIGKRRFRDLLSRAGQFFHETHYCMELRTKGVVREVAFDIMCADGRRLPVLVNSAVTRCEAGSTTSIRTTVFEAGARLRYERQLRAARRSAEEKVRRLRAEQDRP